MRYEGDVYRPPSEARSLIIQVTIGCAHNQCTFCTMYKAKKFRIRTQEEIFADLDEMSERYKGYRLRIFLADGDALIIPTKMMLAILEHIKEKFPHCERITSYATVKDILRKSEEDLRTMQKAGLSMVYVGAESGDEETLKNIHKDVTCEEMIQAAEKLKNAGIKLSLTLISGIAGKERLEQHAIESAKLVSGMKPEYLGFLTLMLEEPAPILDDIRSGRLTLLSPPDVVKEMRLFLSNVDSEGTIFRANHASNYVNLKGNLNEDIPDMLAYLERVEQMSKYKPEEYRLL